MKSWDAAVLHADLTRLESLSTVPRLTDTLAMSMSGERVEGRMGARATLILVESETKAATIGELLGRGFVVLPTLGGATSLEQLTAAREDADEVYVAMDPGREGEAQAYGAATALRLDLSQANRVTFAELTRATILDALDRPRRINRLLVQSAETRRLLLLQSPHMASSYLRQVVNLAEASGLLKHLPYAWAVSLLVDRERAIETFNPTEYWTVEARVVPEASAEPITFGVDAVPAGRIAPPGRRGLHLADRADAEGVAEALKGAVFKVSSVGGRTSNVAPSPPFTTSTLLQAASQRLRFNIRKTMRVAERLYSGSPSPTRDASVSSHRRVPTRSGCQTSCSTRSRAW